VSRVFISSGSFSRKSTEGRRSSLLPNDFFIFCEFAS
jgi:hypothetical protein